MLIAWFSVIVFVVGTVLHFAGKGDWKSYGTALVIGSGAGICGALATHMVKLL
jgi:hypothetical protein